VRGIAIGVIAAVTASTSVGAQVKKRTTYEDMQMFSQVFNQLRVNHPDSLDTHELIIAAIRGMLSQADPHSYVVSATSLVPEKEEAYRSGKLYPVPIEFAMLQGAPVVVSVAAGSAAAREDILPGDELVAIDSAAVDVQSTTELSAVLAVVLLTPTLAKTPVPIGWIFEPDDPWERETLRQVWVIAPNVLEAPE